MQSSGMRDEQWEIVRKHFPAGRPQVRSRWLLCGHAQ